MKEAFIQHIFGQFRQYCMERSLTGSSTHLLEFMLEHKLIPSINIRHYVLLQEHEMMENQGIGKNKSTRVRLLANKYDVHPNTIWNVLKDHKDKFALMNGKF